MDAILITTGHLYTAGRPAAVAQSEQAARRWLEEQGFKLCKDGANGNLFECDNGSRVYFARLDRLPMVETREG